MLAVDRGQLSDERLTRMGALSALDLENILPEHKQIIDDLAALTRGYAENGYAVAPLAHAGFISWNHWPALACRH